MQLFLKAFTAAVTFIISVIATYPVYLLLPLPSIGDVPNLRVDEPVSVEETVTVCELARNPERYEGRIVRLRANLEITRSTEAYSVTDKTCVTEWARVSCIVENVSCGALFDSLRDSSVSSVEFYAEGRFFASVLESPRGGASSRVRLFEITGDVDIKTAGRMFKRRVGRGSGVGMGRGTGDGIGTGRGEGRGSGTGSGYSTNTSSGTGTGSGRGGGGSGGQ